ncbi:3'-5' exonuclease family protein [Legionella impletisoli]|uniref:Excinuclease cho n=1 Tax=Legionella impletisoli TaxID=343510 RepID=A0A917JYB7_9GAMM|nr:exonuclease domain-containing protein [Legionella impletisoli]GGI92167.1 exonuclease [Legionella impletisoli]
MFYNDASFIVVKVPFMQNQSFRWALIDLETTGTHVTQDKITEIAVIIVTEKGVESTWNTLLNPNQSISEAIVLLTGISNHMVAKAPPFAEIAEDLIMLLQDCVLVAHNVRFDYAFLKNAFKSCGLSYQPSMLCTLKLSKALYPQFKRHNLANLVEQFGIPFEVQHRAKEDVFALYLMLQAIKAECSLSMVLEQANILHKKPCIPAHLKTNIHSLSKTPGVYLFYGRDKTLPLYIGKSVSLRQRVLSHFQADHSHAKEFAMAQQVETIEVIETSGELSALLLESSLIKKKNPIYNRRLRRKTLIVRFKIAELNGYKTIEIVRESSNESSNYLIGAFSSIRSAKSSLQHLVKAFRLCPKLCYLEHTKGACFYVQLKRCHGACEQFEPAKEYNQRVFNALEQYQQQTWPFKGKIAIKETHPTTKSVQYLIFDEWRYLGTYDSPTVPMSESKAHDVDVYKILSAYLKKNTKQTEIIELNS